MRIVSGGQTGADRAALDFAIEHSIPHSGWCPKGRKAEDGTIPARYQLTETPSAAYIQRTEHSPVDPGEPSSSRRSTANRVCMFTPA